MDDSQEFQEYQEYEEVCEEAGTPEEAAKDHSTDPGTVSEEVRKKANKYFFSKVAINALLMILGAVLIALFLTQMQRGTALYKQQVSSKESLAEADKNERTEVFKDVVERSGVDYNNSEISGVLNMTKDASVASCEIDVEYGQDLEYVEKVLEEELPKLKKTIPAILDGPEYKGVNRLGESGVTLVIVAKCNEEDIKAVTRGLNKGILQIFYRNGINVPFPNVTISTLDPHSSHEEEREPERPVKKDEGLFQ